MAPPQPSLDDVPNAANDGVRRRALPRNTASTRFTQADIKRAVRAIESAGKPVAAVDFPPEGGFRLLLGEPAVLKVPTLGGKNEWDVVLPA